MKLKTTAATIAAVTLAAWIGLHAVPLPDRLEPTYSTTVSYADGTTAHVDLADDDRWRIETDLEDVDDDYLEALLELEDRRFYDHPGVDPVAVGRAAVSNLAKRRVVSGASTITMQLVRMAEPRDRTLRSKAVEALRALQIEYHYDKDEILEMYLDLLPFGANYEGLQTGAMAYFGHDASNLDAARIATLLAVPQAPHLREPDPDNRAHLRAARNRIAEQLLDAGALPRGMRSEHVSRDRALERVEQTPVPTTLKPMPDEMPHLAGQLRGDYPDSPDIKTTVDRSSQQIAEDIVDDHRDQIERLGGDHASVVVLDHRTGQLEAAVGNFSFDADEPGHHIAAFDTRRSTGSLLKPFLLARAIDRGQATPAHKVADVPVDYGGYRPENFDQTFDGLVRLDDALKRSLNIPFVNLLDDVGVDDFLMLLHHIGAPYPEGPPADHGLSYAVGGIEATPMEVATMFSSLARRGDAVDVRRLQSDEPTIPTITDAALTPESTWMVQQVMRGRDRPSFPGRLALSGGLSPYAWKTGTSMGYRDAWTAGFGPRYVVVAWAGNLDHRPGSNLVGQRAAAPLFFDVVEALDPTRGHDYQPPPEGLQSVEVCSFSGHLPTSACDRTEEIDHPGHSIPTRPCPYHREVDIDVETNQATTPSCRDGREVETETFVQLPADVRNFFDDTGNHETVPDYAPGCRVRSSSSGPDVSSPPDDTTVTLMAGVPTDAQKIPLQARTDGGGPVDWFVDGRFVDRVDDGQRLWWEPEPGDHQFVATDDDGNATHRTVTVE